MADAAPAAGAQTLAGEPPGSELVDWGLAISTGARLARPGPRVTRAGAAEVVRSLRQLADEAEQHVIDYTGLVPVGSPAVVVVDRPEWIRSNVGGLRHLMSPLLAQLSARTSPLSRTIGRRVTGLQVGGALAYLAGRVLGQYEIFLPPEEGVGRLSLVAPNIAEIEARLGVDPRDFRMWVCVHEQTHRIQFGAVPWLRAYLESQIGEFIAVTDLDASALTERLRAVVTSLRSPSGASLIELLQTPEQRAVLDRMQAVMSLLEGHADQVMDAVGPGVVPTVELIRTRFDQRRSDGGSPVDRFVRKLLGMELKMRQYRQGGAFVRYAVEAVGVEGFNRVWTSAETLPTPSEITDPAAWVRRVGA